MANGLTEREEKFLHAMLLDPTSPTECYIKAGYSHKAAKTGAHRLMKKPFIAAALAKARDERSARTNIDADKLLVQLDAEAFADIGDLFNDDDTLKPIRQWPKVWRQGLVAGIDVEELFEGRGESREKIGRVRKIKLADRTRIKELLGKHVNVQAFKEKVEHDASQSLLDVLADIHSKRRS